MQTASSRTHHVSFKCRVLQRSELSRLCRCRQAIACTQDKRHMSAAQLAVQSHHAAPVCLSQMSSRPSSLPAATMPWPGPTNDTSFTVLMLRWPRYLPAAAAAAEAAGATPRKEVVERAWCAESTGNSCQLSADLIMAAPSAPYAHSIWSLDQCGHKKERMMHEQQCAGLTYT
jgi:hypothetical protein